MVSSVYSLQASSPFWLVRGSSVCSAPLSLPYPILPGRQTTLTYRRGYITPSTVRTTLSTKQFVFPLNLGVIHFRTMPFVPVVPPKTSPLVYSTSYPRMFLMPDLVSHCTFDLRVHEELPRAVWECKAWMINGSNISRSEKSLNSLHGLKAGGLFLNLPSLCLLFSLDLCLELTCACYPLAPLHKLRVCCDFMNWLFHLDDLSDDMDDGSTVAIGNEVMATYYHPDTYDPMTRVGKLTKRFVSIAYPSTRLNICSRAVTGPVS